MGTSVEVLEKAGWVLKHKEDAGGVEKHRFSRNRQLKNTLFRIPQVNNKGDRVRGRWHATHL